MIRQTKIVRFLTNYLFLLFVAFIPIWIDIALLILPVSLLLIFLSCSWKGVFHRVLHNRFAMLSILLWFLYLISVLYSDNWSYGLSDVIQKITLLGLPILFIILSRSICVDYKRVPIAFLLGCIISMLTSLVHSTILSCSFVSGELVFNPIPKGITWENHFVYNRLSYLTHPSYFAMYLAFSISILFELIKSSKSYIWRVIYVAGIIGCGVFIFFLSSRTGLIVGGITIIICLIGLLKRWKLIMNICAITGIVAAITLFAMYKSGSSFTQKISDKVLYGIDLRKLDYKKTTDPRFIIWEVVPELIAESPLFGHGTGDIHIVLDEKYKEITDDEYILKNSLNTHNQYFETAIAIGLVGLAMQLAMFFYPIYYYRKSENLFLPLVFIIIFSLNLFTESMITRIAGVIFFALFYSVFYCTDTIFETES